MFDKVHCFHCMYFRGRGVECQKGSTIVFSRVLSDGLACLTIWSMMETHVLLQSSGLNFGAPLDLVQSSVVPTTPKLMIRRRGSTECWSKS